MAEDDGRSSGDFRIWGVRDGAEGASTSPDDTVGGVGDGLVPLSEVSTIGEEPDEERGAVGGPPIQRPDEIARRAANDRYTLVQCVSLESNDGLAPHNFVPTYRSVTPLSGTSFTSVASNVKRLEWDPGADLECQLLLAPVQRANVSGTSSARRQAAFISHRSGLSFEDRRLAVLSRETRQFIDRRRSNSVAELRSQVLRKHQDHHESELHLSSSKSSSQITIQAQSSSSSPGRSNRSRHSPEKIQQQSQRLANNVYSTGSVITVVQRPSPKNSGGNFPPSSAGVRQAHCKEGHGHQGADEDVEEHQSSAESTSADGSFLKYMAGQDGDFRAEMASNRYDNDEEEEVLIVACSEGAPNVSMSRPSENLGRSSDKSVAAGEKSSRRHRGGRNHRRQVPSDTEDGEDSVYRSKTRGRHASDASQYEWWRSVSHQRRAAVTRILDDLARLDDLERMLLDYDTTSSFAERRGFFREFAGHTGSSASDRRRRKRALAEPQVTSTPKEPPQARQTFSEVQAESRSNSSMPMKSETSEDNEGSVLENPPNSDESCSTAVSSIYFAARRPQERGKFRLETLSKRTRSLNRRTSRKHRERAASPVQVPAAKQQQEDLMAQYLRQAGLKLNQEQQVFRLRHKSSDRSSGETKAKCVCGREPRQEQVVVETIRQSMADLSISRNDFAHNFPSSATEVGSVVEEERVPARSIGIQANEASIISKKSLLGSSTSINSSASAAVVSSKKPTATSTVKISHRKPFEGLKGVSFFVPIAEGKSSRREAVPSLQDALRAKRPSFLSKVVERQDILAVRSYLREKATSKKRRRLLEEEDSRREAENELRNGLANGSDSGLEMAVPPPPISGKEMKQRTRAKYRKLPEVKSMVQAKAVQRERELNRVMAKLYKERLLRNVLRGRVNMSNDACVV